MKLSRILTNQIVDLAKIDKPAANKFVQDLNQGMHPKMRADMASELATHLKGLGFRPSNENREFARISTLLKGQIKTATSNKLIAAAALAGLGIGYVAHDSIKKNVGYASYLLPHKYYVGKGMREMGLPWGQTLKHDLSKFTPTEWSAYSEYFNGPTGLHGTNDRKTHEIWRAAVEKHYHRNPHHWRALHLHPSQVPMQYKLEAIADWYGVQRAKGNTKKDFKNWFEDHKQTFPLDKATVDEAEVRLQKQSEFYAQRMSRLADDGKSRKYTWIAADSRKEFDAAKKHVVDNGYKEESELKKFAVRTKLIPSKPKTIQALFGVQEIDPSSYVADKSMDFSIATPSTVSEVGMLPKGTV